MYLKNSDIKLQGKIVNWNDEKGFGFVETHSGERAFVHIKKFTPRGRRPVDGETIIYDLVRESNNRYKADKIKFAAENKNMKQTRKAKKPSVWGTAFTTVFCTALAGAVLTDKLPLVVAGIYTIMSFVTFIAYARDKSAAQNNRWRIKESSLHLFSLIGGWPGAFGAQKILRHKSIKVQFKRVYWLTVLVNIGALFYLLSEKTLIL